MTKEEIKTLREAFNIDMKNFSYTDIEDLQIDCRLSEFWESLTLSECKSILNQVQKEYDKLDDEYNDGDPLCYPPDWWDQYVQPVQTVITMIKDHHEDMIDQLEESEDC